MTVNFQTDDAIGAPYVFYRETGDGSSDPGPYLQTYGDKSYSIEDHDDDRWVHAVELTGLKPGAKYECLAGVGNGIPSLPFSFRTIPDDPTATIRFINGGDMDPDDDDMRILMAQAMETNPMFALLGGDLVYGSRNPFDDDLEDRWDEWFEAWEEIMRTDDGCLVPLVLALGDHEMQGESNPMCDGIEVEFFLDFFAQNGGTPYFSRTFGPNLIVYVLDSGNLVCPADQVDWLRDEMMSFAAIPFQFAAYHHPLYPSAPAKGFDDFWNKESRDNWGPVFDEFGLDTAFEHDAHTLKRTPLLKGGVPDTSGTLYLGDGAFGRGTREAHNAANFDYLAVSEEVKHFWSVEVNSMGATYTAIDIDGLVIDTVALAP